jgi:hypothetical protein
VHPEHVTIGDSLFQLRVVPAEALGKALLPIAAPPHPHEVVRRRQGKANRKQDVVKGAHSGLHQQFTS